MSHIRGLPEDECLTCGEDIPPNECPKSLRPCGHHCNCSWIHDYCHWCGTEEFGAEDGEREGSIVAEAAP